MLACVVMEVFGTRERIHSLNKSSANRKTAGILKLYTRQVGRYNGRPWDVAPASFADGVACMEVLDAIRQSAASGGRTVGVSE